MGVFILYIVFISFMLQTQPGSPLAWSEFKYFSLPDLPVFNWRSVSLWTLSFFQNLIIFTKAITPVLFLTMGHVLRLWNRSIIYSEVRYRYLLLKSKKRTRYHRKSNLLSLILLFMKYLTSCQHKLIDNENICKNHVFLDCPKYIPLMDELSIVFREDHLKAFALVHIRYRSHKSFVRLSLLLSGDIELNPGHIKNPCTICQGNVSIRGLFRIF